MNQEATVNSEQSTVTSPQSSDLSPQGQEDLAINEKLVPVSEAIRYRKRAQAAEKELSELKELHEKQKEELKAMNNSMERQRHDKTTDTGSPIPALALRAADNNAAPPVKTQGVKETRTSGARNVLQAAARQAAGSGSRKDVQEYLRIRRCFV